MNKIYRLFIVEDDNGIAEAIKTQAAMWDIECHIVENYREVMREFVDFEPHRKRRFGAVYFFK